MVNKIVGGMFTIIALAFCLKFFGTITEKLGKDFFANIVRQGIVGIRGG